MKKTKIILLTAIIIGIGTISCTKHLKRIRGEGPVVKETYDMPDISGVALSIDADVYLTHGDSQSVLIEGQQNIIANIEKYVTNDDVWRIGYHHPVKNHAGVKIYITSPNIDYATISGSGSIESTNHFPDSANVYLNISGSGNITFATHANIIESVISGSGRMNLSGSAWEQNINISGSGSVHAFGLGTQNTYVRISGSGSSEVSVENYLEVNISGSGSVYYKGNPEINGDISGSGSIINWN